jgi:phosphoglucomutase
MLMLNYIMTTYQERGLIKGNEFIVKTIVTTETIKTIAERNNIKMYDCYTGFKWIAAIIRDLEGKERYIGGGEESYGFLAQDFVRDKDAVSAMSLMAEIAAWAKDRGMTMYQMIQDIYIKYGFSKEKGISVVRKGKQGAEEIQALMKAYRENPVKSLAGSPVTLVKDFQTLTATDAEGNVTKLDMPCTSNVLQYFTAAGDKVSVRPSGTEPKIKFYIEVRGVPMATYADYDNANRLADEKIEAMKKDLCI